MIIDFKYRFLGSWLGIIALIFLTLSPLSSLAKDSDETSLETVCTTYGIKFVNTDDNNLSDKKNTKHCTYCSISPFEDIFDNLAQLNIRSNDHFFNFLIGYVNPGTRVFFFYNSNLNSPPVA